jgi:hypothetical protein
MNQFIQTDFNQHITQLLTIDLYEPQALLTTTLYLLPLARWRLLYPVVNGTANGPQPVYSLCLCSPLSGRRSSGRVSLEQPGCAVNCWLWPVAASARLAHRQSPLPPLQLAYSRPNHTTSNDAQEVRQVHHLP